MAFEPRGGCKTRYGLGLEEEMKGLVECWRHVLEDQSRDSVRSRSLVVRGTAKSLLHNNWSDLSGDYWDGGGGGWSDMAEPGKWGPGRKHGVRGESHRFHLHNLFLTSAGVVMSSTVVSSRKFERSLGSVGEALAPVEDRRMDFSATLGFLINMRMTTLPYLRQRRCRACRMRKRVVFRSPLKQS